MATLRAMRGYLQLGELKPGDRFRFHYYPTARLSAESYVYLGRGWYRTAEGQKFRSGIKTAVRFAD